MSRRVAVTGLGLVTPLGIGVEPTWSGLVEGRNGIGPIQGFDASDYDCRIAGEVEGFEPKDWMDRQVARRFDRFVQFALAGSKMAMADAGFDDEVDDELSPKAGTIIGSGIGGLPMIEDQYDKLKERGPGRVTPFFIPGVIANMCSGLVSIEYALKGPNSATCTACSTGSHAIGDGFRLIQHGRADLMVVGGSDAVVCRLGIAGFSSMKALSTRNEEPERASRPWDEGRDGFVMGEGCGILVLEEMERAKARGARIYCEVKGYGMSGDAFHVSAPHETGDGAQRVMRAALDDAGLDPSDIDYVNAHGTSTPLGDRIETEAVKATFGAHATQLMVSSTKSMIGHLLGAAGGVEAAVSALTVHHGVVHPTRNLDKPGEGCDLDYVPGSGRETRVRNALSNSFGFGGTNAALVFGQV